MSSKTQFQGVMFSIVPKNLLFSMVLFAGQNSAELVFDSFDGSAQNSVFPLPWIISFGVVWSCVHEGPHMALFPPGGYKVFVVPYLQMY